MRLGIFFHIAEHIFYKTITEKENITQKIIKKIKFEHKINFTI